MMIPNCFNLENGIHLINPELISPHMTNNIFNPRDFETYPRMKKYQLTHTQMNEEK